MALFSGYDTVQRIGRDVTLHTISNNQYNVFLLQIQFVDLIRSPYLWWVTAIWLSHWESEMPKP